MSDVYILVHQVGVEEKRSKHVLWFDLMVGASWMLFADETLIELKPQLDHIALFSLKGRSPPINVENSIATELRYTNSNYRNWKKVFTIFSGSKLLYCFVNGTLPRRDPSHPEYASWI
ncbi:hypothetical protein Leryth_009520 [Lithospermum erythrorhizon]|nr:hypothetical protein Leryth_009520 [Lithospermum erythrorhizon]